jgi:hypothetical protein
MELVQTLHNKSVDYYAGRHLKFSSPEELQSKIDEYFIQCDSKQRTILTDKNEVVIINDPDVPTIAGLAFFLDVDKQTIYNYADEDSPFFDCIRRARAKIFATFEGIAAKSEKNKAALMFLMKNYGYVDIRQIESKAEITNKTQLNLDNLKTMTVDEQRLLSDVFKRLGLIEDAQIIEEKPQISEKAKE